MKTSDLCGVSGHEVKGNKGHEARNIMRGWLIAAVFLTMAVGPAVLFASQYRVETWATTSVTGSAIQSAATYNDHLVGRTGAWFYQPYPGTGNTDPKYSTTLTGTQDTTGTATSSWDSAAASYQTDPQYNPQVPAVTASSYAAADLATGTLRAFATVQPDYYINGSGGYSAGSAGATATGILIDTLHFTNNTGVPTALTLTWQLDGTWVHLTMPDGSSYSLAPAGAVSSLLYFGNANLHTEATSWYGNNYTPGDATVTQSGWLTAIFSSTDAKHLKFTGTYNLNPGVNDLSFYQDLGVRAYSDSIDFSKTGKVGLILPEGVSFTSDSGVFMTPEPTALLLLGIGLGGLAGRRKKKGICLAV